MNDPDFKKEIKNLLDKFVSFAVPDNVVSSLEELIKVKMEIENVRYRVETLKAMLIILNMIMDLKYDEQFRQMTHMALYRLITKEEEKVKKAVENSLKEKGIQ